MILAISGTPGTGKTAVAKILSKDANLISISSLLGEVRHGWDKKRKTRIVDVRNLKRAVRKRMEKNRLNIVEGHLSHLLDADVVVVLRCSPPRLWERLKKKRWAKEKIAENVAAEILDEITIEAIAQHKNVFEIDTTKKDAKKTASAIKKILNNLSTKNYRPGKTDWSEKYKDYLLR